MMYNFYEININNKKFLKESLFDISRFIKKSLKELTILVITFDLLIAMKKEYESDDII